nr:unnamed protein product [Digitaria exilis]
MPEWAEEEEEMGTPWREQLAWRVVGARQQQVSNAGDWRRQPGSLVGSLGGGVRDLRLRATRPGLQPHAER